MRNPTSPGEGSFHGRPGHESTARPVDFPNERQAAPQILRPTSRYEDLMDPVLVREFKGDAQKTDSYSLITTSGRRKQQSTITTFDWPDRLLSELGTAAPGSRICEGRSICTQLPGSQIDQTSFESIHQSKHSCA